MTSMDCVNFENFSYYCYETECQQSDLTDEFPQYLKLPAIMKNFLSVITTGFASFTYILGFILLATSAIYVSPLFCGTNNEMKTIRTPQEMNGGGEHEP